MASISISGWGVNRTYTLTVTEKSYNAASNTSVVSWTLTSSGASTHYDFYLYASVNGTQVYNNWGKWNEAEFPATTGSKSGELTISHNSDGKKTIPFYIEGYAYVYTTYSNNSTYALTNLDRVAPTVTLGNITNIGTNSFTFTMSANASCNRWWYQLNNGAWVEFNSTAGTSKTYTITGLALNTSYTLYVCARKASNAMDGYAAKKTVKTLGYSSITSVTNITLGNAPSVTWTPLSSSFKFRINYTIGSYSWTSGDISPASTSAYTYNSKTLTVADLAPQITASKTGTVRCTLYTYTSSGSLIGSATKDFTVTVPNTVIPSIDSITLAEGTQSGFNEYVKTLSSVNSSVTATGIYGSKISLITMTVDGAIYNASGTYNQTTVTASATSAILNSYGTLPVVITATDSRGYQVSETRNITVYDYFTPSATMDVDVYDTTITVTVTGEIAPVDNLNQKRLVITRVRLSDQATDTFTVNPLPDYTFEETWTQTLADASTSTYEYTAVVYDTINNITLVDRTGVVTLSLLGGGGGAALFGRASESGFWIYDTTGAEIRHDITSAEYLELAETLADTYSVTADYYVGEFCTYNSSVWECNAAITGGEAWNASHWTELGAMS